MDGHYTDDSILGFQSESSQPDERLQRLQQRQQQQLQLQPEGGRNFKYPPKPARRGLLSKEERTERKERYDRIEVLTRELTVAVRDEMKRRKELWDVEGDREEEEFWESRKQEVYKGLEELAGEIQRAFRDRRKEAVLELWSKELEERRASSSASTRPERSRSRRSSGRDEG
ncbi:hypothetical protein BDD12DRAFT_885925 [Trichophaea hybrida]|nr:hypothetical protein BDD12DRAFT_885925 [Trichophaea hybrida]